MLWLDLGLNPRSLRPLANTLPCTVKWLNAFYATYHQIIKIFFSIFFYIYSFITFKKKSILFDFLNTHFVNSAIYMYEHQYHQVVLPARTSLSLSISPSVPIILCSRQVFQTTSCVCYQIYEYRYTYIYIYIYI